MYVEVKINCWYNNGSLDTFRDFCIQNQNRKIYVKLASRSEPVKGTLYAYRLDSLAGAGIFLLLTNKVNHPAYYSLDSIENVHVEFKKKQLSLEDCEFSRDRFSSEISVTRLAHRSA
jgi:hypothetical protein